MRPMPTERAQRLRAAALVAGAAYAVHQLRFALAGGAAADPARAGHAYLGGVRVLLALTLAAAGSQLLVALVRAARGAATDERRGARTSGVAGASSVVLAAIYAAQELSEGLLSPGHPLGTAGVLGHGGWVALPLCVLFGVLVALALRGARALIARVARAPTRSRPHGEQLPVVRHITRGARPRVAPMASAGPGRAPPLRRPAPAR